MNFFDNAHSVYVSHLINNLRANKLRGYLIVYVSALISQADTEEPKLVYFSDKKMLEMSDPLVATAKSDEDYPLGNYVILNVSINACPDFKVDMETDIVSGSLTMQGRPCYFKVPTQFVVGIRTGGVDHSFHPRTYTNHFLHLFNNQVSAPEKPKRPTLSVVK